MRKIAPSLLFALFLLSIGALLVVKSYAKYHEMRPLALYVTAMGSLILALLIFTAAEFAVTGRRALWIHNGRLIYLNKLFVVIDCASIEAFSLGRLGPFQRPQILVALTDGRTKAIPIQALAEPVETVLANLNEAITGNRRATVVLPPTIGQAPAQDRR